MVVPAASNDVSEIATASNNLPEVLPAASNDVPEISYVATPPWTVTKNFLLGRRRCEKQVK